MDSEDAPNTCTGDGDVVPTTTGEGGASFSIEESADVLRAASAPLRRRQVLAVSYFFLRKQHLSAVSIEGSQGLLMAWIVHLGPKGNTQPVKIHCYKFIWTPAPFRIL